MENMQEEVVKFITEKVQEKFGMVGLVVTKKLISEL